MLFGIYNISEQSCALKMLNVAKFRNIQSSTLHLHIDLVLKRLINFNRDINSTTIQNRY